MKWALFGIRLLLGGVFLFAGGIKFLRPQDFADSIAAYQIVPFILVNPLALGLPVFESVVGILFIVGWQVRPVALAISGMLLAFTFGITSVIARGMDIDCGCFGQSWLDATPTVALIRDLFLLALSVGLYGMFSRKANNA